MARTAVSPQRKYPRTARVNEVMLEVLADELERLSDPRLELVTLTGVKVTRDLAYATVYYSTLAATAAAATSPSFEEHAGDALRSAAPHLRGLVGRQMRIRQVPRLTFELDPGILAGQRIEEILRGIHHDAEPQDEAEADEEE
ncbi:MAG: 30S ribosome-binding factor RbfA [Acidimicrobiia bacterium]